MIDVRYVHGALQVWAPLTPTAAMLADLQARLAAVDPACTVRAGPAPALFTVTFDGVSHHSHVGILCIPVQE